MKNFYQYIAPFAPDYSGAVAVLYETRALIVLCDPGGCSGNVCGYDEPRFYENGGAVYSAALRDMDAIWGQDNKLVDKIVGAARFSSFELIALVGTPVVSVIATDLEAVCRMVEERTGIRTISINTNGLELYDRGEAKTRKLLERLFPGKYKLGPTPLDSMPDEHTLNRIACEVKAADPGRILIIHQPEAANALRARLLKESENNANYNLSNNINDSSDKSENNRGNNSVEIVTGSWFKGCDIKFDDEEEFIKECLNYDVVVCDLLYNRAIDSPSAQRIAGDYRPTVISFPHLAVSGDLFMNQY